MNRLRQLHVRQRRTIAPGSLPRRVAEDQLARQRPNRLASISEHRLRRTAFRTSRPMRFATSRTIAATSWASTVINTWSPRSGRSLSLACRFIWAGPFRRRRIRVVREILHYRGSIYTVITERLPHTSRTAVTRRAFLLTG